MATTGLMLSITVTVTFDVDVLLFTSIALNTNVLAPTSEQSKLLLSIAMLATWQLSDVPLSKSVAVIVACPFASK